MNPSPTDVLSCVASVPLRRYSAVDASRDWEVVAKSMVSPASDGTVIYFHDTLSPLDGEGNYLDGSARACCQYLLALALQRNVELSSGPFLQVLEDDGAVPPGWVMLRALIWVDEYDSIVPMESSDISDAGLQVGI